MIVYVGAWREKEKEGKKEGGGIGGGGGKFSTLTMIYRVNASVTFAHLHVPPSTDLIQHRHTPRT